MPISKVGFPASTYCAPQFGSLHHHQHLTTFFGTARTAFYGTYTYICKYMYMHLQEDGALTPECHRSNNALKIGA